MLICICTVFSLKELHITIITAALVTREECNYNV